MSIVSVTSLVLAPFQYAFVQRGLLEVVLLSVGAGLLGTWIVLRGLAFFSHAAGTAAFPGLVLADGLGFSAPLGAFAAALAFAFGVERLARSRRSGYDSLTALVLVGALALGVILASDVFHSGASVDSLLFGSLLLIGTRDLVLAALSSAIVLGASLLLGRRWLAIGFDAGSARALGIRSAVPDAILLVLIALGIVSALPAIGALLVTALFVVPAATVRLVTRRLRPWQVGSVALVAGEGVLGLWLSVEWNVPPGAAISVLAGAIFAVVAGVRLVSPSVRRLAPAAAALLLARGVRVGPRVLERTAGGRDHDPDRRLGPRRWAGRTRACARSCSRTPTRTSTSRGRPTSRRRRERSSCSRTATTSTRWMGKVISEAGGEPTVVDLGSAVPVERAGETSGPEASRYDPHWWHDPTNAIAAVGEIRDALVRADPKHAPAYRQTRRRLRREAARARPRHRRVLRAGAARAAEARHGPRRLRLLRRALRDPGRRGRDPVPDDPGPAVGRRDGEADRPDPSRARRGRLPRELDQPEAGRRRSRARPARAPHYTLYGDTLGPRGSAGATYLSMDARERRCDGARLHRRPGLHCP